MPDKSFEELREEERVAGMKSWLESRPAPVRALAAEFPFGTVLSLPDGSPLYVLGYTEDDKLIVSLLSPWDDYDAAVEAQERVCARHFRRAE